MAVLFALLLSLAGTACADEVDLEAACAYNPEALRYGYELHIPEDCRAALEEMFPAPQLETNLSSTEERKQAQAVEERYYEALYINISFPAAALPSRKILATDLTLPASWDDYILEVDMAAGQTLPSPVNLELAEDLAAHFSEVYISPCKRGTGDTDCNATKAATLRQSGMGGAPEGELSLYYRFGQLSPWTAAATLTHENLHHSDYGHGDHRSCPWRKDGDCDTRLDESYASVLFTIAQLEIAYLTQSTHAGTIERVSLSTIGEQARRSCERLYNYVVDFRHYVDAQATDCNAIVDHWARELSAIRARRELAERTRRGENHVDTALVEACTPGWSPACQNKLALQFPLQDFFGAAQTSERESVYRGLWALIFSPVSLPSWVSARSPELSQLALDAEPIERLRVFGFKVERIVDETTMLASALTAHQPVLLANELKASGVEAMKASVSGSETPVHRTLDRALKAYIGRHLDTVGDELGLLLGVHLGYLRGASRLTYSAYAPTLQPDLEQWRDFICERYGAHVPGGDCARWVDEQAQLDAALSGPSTESKVGHSVH